MGRRLAVPDDQDRKKEPPWSRHSAPTPLASRSTIPDGLDRLTTLFRVFLIIPIAIVLSLVSAAATSTTVVYKAGEVVETTSTGGGIAGGLFAATVLMILFRQRYPRWWFDFLLAFNRFGTRVGAYLALLTDRYRRPRTSRPSTWTWTIQTRARASTGGYRWSSGCWRCPTTSCCCSSAWVPSSPW